MKVVNNYKKGEGFTLIEILVVLGLFTLLSLLIINVFLLSLNAQRKASARQEAVSSLRFVMETMAQEIRTSEINYNAGIDDRILNLRFGDKGTQYSLVGGQIKLRNGKIVDAISSWQVSVLNDVSEIVVTELHFFVDPPNDPFAEERCNIDGPIASGGDCTSGSCTINDTTPGKEFKAGFCWCSTFVDCSSIVGNCNTDVGLCLPFDRQPRVTIVMAFQPVSNTGPDTTPIYMQTTISSRIYKR